MDTQDSRWYEELFDAIHQFIGILDGQGKVVKANQAALDLTGLTHSDISERYLWDLPWQALSKANRQELKRAVRRSLQGDFVRIELEICLYDNQTADTLDFTFKPILNGSGTVTLVIAEGRNISINKLTTEALHQTRARFATIYQRAAIGIVIKGPDGKMIDCNPAFLEMLGYELPEIRSRHYLEITHPLDQAISRKLFKELLDGKRDGYSLVKRYLTKTGNVIWASVNASLVRSTDKKVQFTIVMVEDITAQKLIEAELIELRHRLMRGREMERLQLAQDLHDGPLQEIIGISYQLKELESMLQQEATREQLLAAQTALQQVASSIRSVCSNLRPPTLMPFGLEKAILSHSEKFQAEHPGLLLELDLARDGQTLPEHVRISMFRIYQEALNNILRHAQASKVIVNFTIRDDQAYLEIKDDGRGFKPPDHWIEMARQGHLGLVGAIERAHEVGGHLDIKSRTGKGTLIRAVIPVQEQAFDAQTSLL
jgi:PAS domain S-box-containing protein